MLRIITRTIVNLKEATMVGGISNLNKVDAVVTIVKGNQITVKENSDELIPWSYVRVKFNWQSLG